MFLLVVAVLSISAASVAQNETNNKNVWKMDLRMDRLGRYLELNASQYEKVFYITEYFAEKMRYASYAKNEKQGKRLREAVYGNFKIMKETLTEEQYKKYVYLMSTTLKNRGLDVYLQDVASR